MSLTDHQICERLSDNIAQIGHQIHAAASLAGRTDHVQLVAVTKYTSLHVVKHYVDLGHTELAENRPQQLIERAGQIPSVNWHLIGQLQSNKVRSILPHVRMIHSVDSLKLLKRILQLSEELACTPQLLLQVNIAKEETKSGFDQQELLKAWDEISSLKTQQICGFMTMAPLTKDEQLIRSTFRGLRKLRDQLQATSPHMQLKQLSMGMSSDYEIAIEEGATLIRLGSSLFEGCE